MMKSSLIGINLIFILLVLFIPNLVSAESKTFIKEYTYQASEADSKLSSRVIALEQVKRLLLEELGTYLESHTEVVNFQLTKDQITALTAGIVQTKIIKEKWDGERYWMQAKIEADPNEVAKSVDSLRKDRQSTKELEDIRKKASELTREVEKLRKELKVVKTDQNKIARYNEAIRELSATDWFEKGKVFIISRNFSEAINAMTNAIQLDPKNEWAYLNRGLAYRGLNAYQESLNDYNKVIEMDIDVIVEIPAYCGRASVYEALGKYQNAIDDMTKVIERNPKDPINYVQRGRLYKKSGNNQEAENDFNKAFALTPKSADANLSLAFAYLELGNYEQAINSCDKTIALDPKNIWAYYLRGYSYDKLGNTDRAIKEYDRTIELDPNNSTAYHGRGNIFRKLGYYERALIEYNKGIIINPRDIHLMCDIARLYALKNDSIKACEWLRESIENGYKELELIRKDSDFRNIKDAPCFRVIIKK